MCIQMKLVVLFLCMVQYVYGDCMVTPINGHVSAAQLEAHLISIGKTTIGDSLTSGSGPFYFCKTLESIEIPAMVTSIGYKAFSYATKLTSVDFSQATGLKHIGEKVFSENRNLTSVDFSGATALETIGYKAFRKTGFTSVAFSGATSLTTIGDYAFFDSPLTSVDFSGATSLTTIGDYAFYRAFPYIAGKTPYTSVIFSKKPTNIGTDQFTVGIPHHNYDAPAYTYCLRTPDSNGHVSAAALDGVTEIGSSTEYTGFYGCSALKSIEIPASVNTIHKKAFNGTSLTSITMLGNSVINDATPISYGKQLTLSGNWVEVPVVSPSELNATWSNMPCGVSGQVYQRGSGTCMYNHICFDDGTVLECPSGAVRLSTDQCSSRKSDLLPIVRAYRGIVCSVE